jgi:hypothetical protein
MKDGRDIDCRVIMVFDKTNPGLPVLLWNTETVLRAVNWRPHDTGIDLFFLICMTCLLKL